MSTLVCPGVHFWKRLTHDNLNDGVSRFWLNIKYKGAWAGEVVRGTKLPWGRRIRRAVSMTLHALVNGETVLVHCLAGKHRSGAFAVLILSLLWEVSRSTFQMGAPPARPPGWSHQTGPHLPCTGSSATGTKLDGDLGHPFGRRLQTGLFLGCV